MIKLRDLLKEDFNIDDFPKSITIISTARDEVRREFHRFSKIIPSDIKYKKGEIVSFENLNSLTADELVTLLSRLKYLRKLRAIKF